MSVMQIVGLMLLSVVAVGASAARAQSGSTLEGNAGTRLEARVLGNFDAPWAMSFLPDGQALVSEKAGSLWLLNQDGDVLGQIDGLPEVQADGQGGFGDVLAHPAFADNRLIYLSWVERDESGSGAVVGRGELTLDADGGRLDALEILWQQAPRLVSTRHYSHRLAFDDAGFLYITSGDRGMQTPAQDLTNNLGTIVRLESDGAVPPDNPFSDEGESARAFWTVGHRNPLGIAFAPDGALWSHEMGPRGGDELNRIEKGANYGWPSVSDGDNYSGEAIPDHGESDEFRAPAISWVPSVSPAGLVIYDGEHFASWQGQALMGALSGRALLRVALDGDTATELERFEWGARVREVEQAPDGSVWVLEDGPDARLLRFSRAD